MYKIVLNDDEIREAQQFADEVVSTVSSYYRDRGQSNIDNIKKQTFIGKLGEYGARSWLLLQGYQCSDINLTVTYNKTFDADLILNNGIKCHVKSQDLESANRFGISWTFQFSGQGGGHRDKEIFDNYDLEDRVVFCLVQSPVVYICAQVYVSQLHEMSLFGLPKKESLRGIKKVVYYDSIPEQLRVK